MFEFKFHMALYIPRYYQTVKTKIGMGIPLVSEPTPKGVGYDKIFSHLYFFGGWWQLPPRASWRAMESASPNVG